MTIERGAKARGDYLQSLRDESYIKIAASYRDSVAPLLKLPPETTAENGGSSTPKPEKKKGKLLGIFPRP